MYLRKNTRREVPLGNWKAERMAESGEDLVWAEMERSIDLARVKGNREKAPPKQKKDHLSAFWLWRRTAKDTKGSCQDRRSLSVVRQQSGTKIQLPFKGGYGR